MLRWRGAGFEFTHRGAIRSEVFAALVKYATTECPEMILGTVPWWMREPLLSISENGANFVVGAATHPDIAKVCNAGWCPIFPGSATPSEVGQAQELGSVVVKIFPAGTVGGPSFVKNIKAPMPWSNIMVTGGVEPTRKNLNRLVQSRSIVRRYGQQPLPERNHLLRQLGGDTGLCAEVLATIANSGTKNQ